MDGLFGGILAVAELLSGLILFLLIFTIATPAVLVFVGVKTLLVATGASPAWLEFSSPRPRPCGPSPRARFYEPRAWVAGGRPSTVAEGQLDVASGEAWKSAPPGAALGWGARRLDPAGSEMVS